MTSPAAGWYADPASPAYVRWWDGASWTEHAQLHPDRAADTATQPTGAAPVAPIEPTFTATAPAEILRPTATATVERPALPDWPHVSQVAPDPLDESADPHPGRSGNASRSTIIGGVSLAVGVISLFLPWMSSDLAWANAFEADLPWLWTGGDFVTGETGLVGHGVLFAMLCAVGLLALAGRLPNRRLATVAVGGLMIVLAAADYLSFSGSVDAITGLDIGYGLYAMVLSGIGLFAAGALTEQE